MGEAIKAAAKTPVANKENIAPKIQKLESSRSMDSPVEQVLFLQSTAGNRAVSRLIKSGSLQAKLRIGRPGDIYEQEADRVAEQVMRMPESRKPVIGISEVPHTSPVQETCIDCKDELQRQVEEEEDTEKIVQTKMISGHIVPEIQREAEEEELSRQPDQEKEEEEEILQTKGIPGKKSEITPDLESNIYTLRNAGKQLPESSRTLFESRFGRDFSHVRVHTDTRAAESAKVLNARAFTVGQDVVFGSGQYSPGTGEGRRLLAHELTHVVQQRQGEIKTISFSILQKNSKEAVSTEKKNVSPPIYWGTDHSKGRVVAIPKPGVSLEEVATFLYGSPSATGELASINKISTKSSLVSGNPLYLTGKKLTETAYNSLNTSTKVPIGVNNPEEFISKEKKLNEELQKDFDFIVKKLNESYYSDSDEGEVISILRKWGEEKFTTNPKLYPEGGEFLDKLFSKLARKTKDVGIISDQITSYYSLIFNHFDRMDEVKTIRDRYSRNFKGDSGIKEMSFGSFFWEQVKEGKVRDQIFAYFKGLGKGVLSGAKGMVTMVRTLLTDPKKFISDIKNLPSALKALWENKGDLWKKFTSASPEKQAEMIGELFGEIEFMIASAAVGGAAAKGVEKMAQLPGKIGKIAKVAQYVTKIPKRAVGAVAKAVKTVVLGGGRIAVEGAIFAAKGVYRIGGKILRGTWSVAEKIIGKVSQNLYYFYDDAARVLKLISKKIANKFCKCSNCFLTAAGKLVSEKVEVVLKPFKILIKNRTVRGRVKRILESGTIDPDLLLSVLKTARKEKSGVKRILRYIERMSENNIPNMEHVLSDLTQGGNKFRGAEWVLRYIDRRRLWKSVKEFEVLDEAGALGKRAYDAKIDGILYQFKSWGEFHRSTFFNQIRKDLEITSLDELKWVFEARELGSKSKIIKEMTDTLLEAVKNGKMEETAAKSIIQKLDSIVIVY